MPCRVDIDAQIGRLYNQSYIAITISTDMPCWVDIDAQIGRLYNQSPNGAGWLL